MENRSLGLEFVNFMGKAVSPFHAVQLGEEQLVSHNFEKINEEDPWHLQPGGKYFLTRNQSSLIAFVVGSEYNPEQSAFRLLGTHTDSPCPKLAPNSNKAGANFV